MLSVEKTAPDRVDIRFSGKLDAEGMEDGLQRLIESSKDMQSGKLFYRITDFAIPEMPALAVEFKYLPSLFQLIGKYEKCAVVCDTDWVRKVAEFEGMLMPGLTIRAFEPEREEEAEAWLES
ncbi:SpoIIAA-like protein [Roseibium hamelinense]|uniref:SpoIIAA-like protein n=1 Tax=Roseibium hamelinense TaxID=150831 RepID=A0A562SUB3_9HYPH|nr:STAS/SEC14 domain-containing protein [Roseibium hamelinense]MTI43079.1 STAS/SEC14 domain-containing protein [Roseibium hamelinense]TWI84618.1 SpoIIAA-like protein [Roseibium hamelinense]